MLLIVDLQLRALGHQVLADLGVAHGRGRQL